jgi:hypothetical protein
MRSLRDCPRIMLITSRGGFPGLDEGFDPCPDEVSSADE